MEATRRCVAMRSQGPAERIGTDRMRARPAATTAAGHGDHRV